MASSSHLIVWDLDHTLGRFGNIARPEARHREVILYVRAGLVQALTRLQHAGCRHTLLTLGTHAYADFVLRATGLRHFFHAVEGRGQRLKGDVDGLADVHAIADDHRAAQMLFVGDHPIFDVPLDPRVVFIHEPHLNRHADELERLILALRRRGRGSFARGFARLFTSSKWPWSNPPIRPHEAPVERMLPGLDPLILLARDQLPPTLMFASEPAAPATLQAHTIGPLKGNLR